MVISQNIKNLVSGVSQQPPILRLPEQLDEQINGLSTESNGLQKRPPTLYLPYRFGAPQDAAMIPLVHFINRDEEERHILLFQDNSIQIITLDAPPSPQEAIIKEDSTYLQTANPRKDLRVITVADYTFIVNRNVKVQMTDKTSEDVFNTQGCLIHVKSGQYGRTYTIQKLDGTTIASYTTPDGSASSHVTSITTTNIVNQLVSSLKSKGYEVESGSAWLRIKGIQNVSCTDGYNNQAMLAINNAVQVFSDLPYAAPDGYVVEVKGSPDNSNAGNYYVKYNGIKKLWEECVCPNIPISLDASTMPHVLVRESDGSFTFKRAEWSMREIGDEYSNPLPSFVDKKLNDIFFYRNRLGVLADENVILSESGGFFNWWMTTANDILDTDPIDIPTTTNRINILTYAVPFDQNLYVFSESTQFLLNSDTVLSPKNTSLLELTNFDSSPTCRPVVAGKNLYFPSERAEYTSIKEYYNVQQVSDVKNAQDISSHVPSYIPNGVYSLVSNNNENILLALTEGDNTCIYVYKYLFLNEQRVQASWSKWEMSSRVFGAFFIGSTLYLVIQGYRSTGALRVMKMNFTYNSTETIYDVIKGKYMNEPYRVYLDSKIAYKLSGNDYDEELGATRIKAALMLGGMLKYPDDARPTIGVVCPDGTYYEFKDVKNYIYLEGDHSGETIVIGYPYTFKATLSPIYIRQTKQNGNIESITNGRLQVRDLQINYANTGGFVVHVNKYNHEYIYKMTPKTLGSYTLGKIVEDSGIFRVPIQAVNTGYTAWIESDLPVPLSIIGYLWRGNFVQKSKGV